MTKIRDIRLTDSYELSGQWWLPRLGRDTAVGGLLECTPAGGVKLRLLDAIETPESVDGHWSFSGEDTSEEVIHGATFDGPLEITLLNCESPGTALPRGAATLQRQVFRCDWALFGVHSDTTVESARALIEVDGMTSWAGTSGLGDPDFDSPASPSSISLTWHRPPPIEGDVLGSSFAIRWGSGMTSGWRTAGLEPSPYLEVTSPDPLGLEDWVRNWVGPTRDLSTLLMNSPMAEVSLTLVLKHASDKPRDRVHVQVYFRGAFTETADQNELPLVNIGRDIPQANEVLERWFEVARGPLRPAIGRTVGSKYRHGYLENDLLSLASSLEIYHRMRRKERRRLTAATVAAIKDAVGPVLDDEAIDSETTRSVLQSLHYIGEPTFASRIRDLAEQTSAALPGVVERPGVYARSLTSVRNDAAHGRALSLSFEETYWLVRTANWIMIALLLDEAGIPAGTVSSSVTRRPRYRWLVGQSSLFKWGSPRT